MSLFFDRGVGLNYHTTYLLGCLLLSLPRGPPPPTQNCSNKNAQNPWRAPHPQICEKKGPALGAIPTLYPKPRTTSSLVGKIQEIPPRVQRTPSVRQDFGLYSFPSVFNPLLHSKALWRQLLNVLHHHSILPHRCHPPWLGIRFRIWFWGCCAYIYIWGFWSSSVHKTFKVTLKYNPVICYNHREESWFTVA